MWSPDLSGLRIRENMDQENASNILIGQNKEGNNQSSSHIKRKLETTPVNQSVKRQKLSTSRRLIKRSLSFGDEPLCDTTDAVANLLTEESYIGDGSRPYCLPTVPGQHKDLKSITPETMKELLQGTYDDVISSYRIIDCRYPYEYNGGHIRNAENCFTEERINQILSSSCRNNDTRDIIVFHCEFSCKRGPKLLRYLRNKDREMNSSHYPRLNFPEIYLLEGGYKSFFETNKNFCEPAAYIPMLQVEHKVDVRQFRVKTSRMKKACSNEIKQNVAAQRLLFSMC